MKQFSILTLTILLLLMKTVSTTQAAHEQQPSKQGMISVPGEEFYYQKFGPTGKGNPIIVLHGGPGMDQSYLLPQMLELAKDHEEIFMTTFLHKPYDLRPSLKKLMIPTLIIHGAEDPIPPTTAEKTHKALPHSTLVILKNCGHFSYIEQPKKCFEAIRNFLS